MPTFALALEIPVGAERRVYPYDQSYIMSRGVTGHSTVHTASSMASSPFDIHPHKTSAALQTQGESRLHEYPVYV